MKNKSGRSLTLAIAALMAVALIALVTGCAAGGNPHDLCDCDEQLARLETENSQLSERVDTLESQISELMAAATTTTETTEPTETAASESETEPTTTTTAATTKNQGGGNKTTKPSSNPTTAAPTTAAPTSPPPSDGFGTDVGM